MTSRHVCFIKSLLLSSLLVVALAASGCASTTPAVTGSNVRAPRHARLDSRAEFGWPSMRPVPGAPTLPPERRRDVNGTNVTNL